MKRIIIIVTLVTTAVVILANLPRKRDDFFITQRGVYNLKGDSHTINIFEDSNGLLNIRTVEPGCETTWESGWIDPAKSWFVYVDQINEVWLNHDDQLCYIYSLDKMRGIHSVNLYPNAKFEEGKLIDIIPEKVIERLSASTLKEIGKFNMMSHSNPLPAD